MDSTLVEALLLPWWKVPVYICTITLSVVAVRISIKFDLNAWLKRRRHSQLLSKIGKRSEQCRHGWNLYTNAPYSQCASCQAWIATSVLLAARAIGDSKLIILAAYPGAIPVQKGEFIVVQNYVGVEDRGVTNA